MTMAKRNMMMTLWTLKVKPAETEKTMILASPCRKKPPNVPYPRLEQKGRLCGCASPGRWLSCMMRGSKRRHIDVQCEMIAIKESEDGSVRFSLLMLCDVSLTSEKWKVFPPYYR
jgi:hypothetical protein